MKRLIIGITVVCAATVVLAKTYEITIEACEVGSSCSRCVERNKLTFDVDGITKTVVANGVAVDGLAVREVMKGCNVQDENNWSCKSAFVNFEAKNGVVSLSNKHRQTREGQHEVCQLRG